MELICLKSELSTLDYKCEIECITYALSVFGNYVKLVEVDFACSSDLVVDVCFECFAHLSRYDLRKMVRRLNRKFSVKDYYFDVSLRTSQLLFTLFLDFKDYD